MAKSSLPLCAVAAAAALAALAIPLLAQAPQTPAPAASAPKEKTAEQAYKNIKVLNGMPASQLMPVMHLMRASLGVRCDFCHVAENGKYHLDTNKHKETARQMIRMTQEINRANFEGQTEVTCHTCHRGQEHPARVLPIGQGLFADTTRAEPGPGETEREKRPEAAEVLDRYIAALGGRAALESVTSRVSRGTLLRMKVVDSGTPKAKAVNRGQEDPLELVEKAPFQKELALRDRAAKARVTGKDQIDGRDVVLVRIPADDGSPALLAFDAQTGLLRRQTVYRPTFLGPDPQQTDYEDYREVDGVKVPFLVTASYVDDNHLGTTLKVTEVRHNTVP